MLCLIIREGYVFFELRKLLSLSYFPMIILEKNRHGPFTYKILLYWKLFLKPNKISSRLMVSYGTWSTLQFRRSPEVGVVRRGSYTWLRLWAPRLCSLYWVIVGTKEFIKYHHSDEACCSKPLGFGKNNFHWLILQPDVFLQEGTSFNSYDTCVIKLIYAIKQPPHLKKSHTWSVTFS